MQEKENSQSLEEATIEDILIELDSRPLDFVFIYSENVPEGTVAIKSNMELLGVVKALRWASAETRPKRGT